MSCWEWFIHLQLEPLSLKYFSTHPEKIITMLLQEKTPRETVIYVSSHSLVLGYAQCDCTSLQSFWADCYGRSGISSHKILTLWISIFSNQISKILIKVQNTDIIRLWCFCDVFPVEIVFCTVPSTKLLFAEKTFISRIK